MKITREVDIKPENLKAEDLKRMTKAQLIEAFKELQHEFNRPDIYCH